MPRETEVEKANYDWLKLEKQLCFSLVLAARNIVGKYKAQLEPLGLTHPQYLVLLTLWESSPLSVKELAKQLHLEAATLSPILKRLEKLGYLERHRSETDERRLEVKVTEAGWKIMDQVAVIQRKVMQSLNLAPEDLTQLKNMLDEFNSL